MNLFKLKAEEGFTYIIETFTSNGKCRNFILIAFRSIIMAIIILMLQKLTNLNKHIFFQTALAMWNVHKQSDNKAATEINDFNSTVTTMLNYVVNLIGLLSIYTSEVTGYIIHLDFICRLSGK